MTTTGVAMHSLTLPTLDTQLSTIELELQQLQEAIEQKKALRKVIADKKKQAVQVVSKLETALMQVTETFSELGESAKELKAIALEKIEEYFPVSEKESKLVEFPKKKNDSNEFFTLAETSNSLVANYFNVSAGKTQATYIGGNNKNRLQSIGNKLTELITGISFELSIAQRFNTKYELKIKGIEDNTIGWLTQFDYSQDFYPQFVCSFDQAEIPTELKITPKNWVASPGAIIKNNIFDYCCHLQETDVVNGTGIAKDLKTSATFSIYLDDWSVETEFYREATFVYQAMLACNSKEELTAIKNSNQINQDFLNFCCVYMPVKDQQKIDDFCKTTPSEAVLKLPSGLAHYKEIAQEVLEEISKFYTITANKKRAKDVSCWNLIAQSGAKAKLYLSQGFEWTIEPFKKGEQLSDCFPEDITDFLANNDVFVDELYEQIA